MPSKQTTPCEFHPFPRNSVNLVTGPTSSGKTYFVTQLLNHYRRYFLGPVDRIVVILCNERIQQLSLEPDAEGEAPPEVIQIPLGEFDPDFLQENDLVVIDDLQALTEVVRLSVSVCAHHYNLASLFIVTHSLLGNKRHFELLTLCHRVFLFLKGTANVRLFKYLNSNFFQDPDIQQALKEIVPFCQRQNQVLCLELNPLASASSDRLGVLGFSHLPSLVTSGYFVLYTTKEKAMEYSEEYAHSRVEPDLAGRFSSQEELTSLPPSALVVVPATSVLASLPETPMGEQDAKCSDRQQWQDTLEEIEELIESNFVRTRWMVLKNLAKELLKIKSNCFYTDGRHFHKRGKPKVPLLDFLGTVSRQATINESVEKPEFKLYRPYVRELRSRGVSSTLLRNKLI